LAKTEEERQNILKKVKFIAWRNSVENIGRERESEHHII